jgi:hypothetical protein
MLLRALHATGVKVAIVERREDSAWPDVIDPGRDIDMPARRLNSDQIALVNPERLRITW